MKKYVKLIDKDWLKGGTFITNFHEFELRDYQASIKLYRKFAGFDVLTISKPHRGYGNIFPLLGHSLHFVNRNTCLQSHNLRLFWKIRDMIRKREPIRNLFEGFILKKSNNRLRD